MRPVVQALATVALRRSETIHLTCHIEEAFRPQVQIRVRGRCLQSGFSGSILPLGKNKPDYLSQEFQRGNGWDVERVFAPIRDAFTHQ